MRASIRPDPTSWKGILSTTLLVSAWLYLHISSLKWLLQSFRQASSFNLILICLVVTGLLVQIVRYRQQFEVSATALRMRTLPLLLMLGSAVSALALQWLIDIEQITVILFALGTYGLCGLFLQPDTWRKGLPAAALIAAILPFCTQFGTGLGFPVRVLTARVVEQMLSVWHIAAVSSYDIIVLENGIAHVDLPCSGLRSLWTGTLFLLATTWLEGRQMGTRWLLVCGASLFLLILSNIVRVLILVLITNVLQQPTSAQMLHLPLGLLGFVCACGLTWVMLQSVPNSSPTPPTPSAPPAIKLQALLLICIITLALIPQLRHPQEKPLSIASLNWPQQMVSERVSLTAAEQRFFDNTSAAVPEKRRFGLGELSGSILLVSSTSWASYHPPELCFVGSGLKVDGTQRKWLTPSVQARWLSLQDGKLSATYWFQSPEQTTDDFLSRLWSQVTRRQKTWVMVSVLFDSSQNPASPEVRTFATTIHDVIDHSLNGGQL
jgi:exosortase O